MPQNVLLPDDYLKRKVYTEDDFYVWERSGNRLVPLRIKSAAPIDADHLTVMKKKLLFINRYDQKLYQFAMPSSLPTGETKKEPTDSAGEP